MCRCTPSCRYSRLIDSNPAANKAIRTTFENIRFLSTIVISLGIEIKKPRAFRQGLGFVLSRVTAWTVYRTVAEKRKNTRG